jgi:hypothetical protein
MEMQAPKLFQYFRILRWGAACQIFISGPMVRAPDSLRSVKPGAGVGEWSMRS